MIKSLFFLLAISILVIACTRYQSAPDSPSGIFKPLSIATSDSLSAEANSQSSSDEAISTGWVTYGKTSYGDLKGYLFVPAGNQPFPAVIFNHGSKVQPEPKRALTRFFNNVGFVVLLPHSRGYGNSPGPALEEAITFDIESYEGKMQLVKRLRKESEDVLSVLSFVKSLPYVDSKRIVISGYSFGGITTLMAASKTSDFKAGVVFATASGTWRLGGAYRQELINTVRQVYVPLLFIYAENDYDLSPGIVFSREMRRAGKSVNLKIYPPFGESE